MAKKRTIWVYRCATCGMEASFPYELNEMTPQRCSDSNCMGYLVFSRTEER